MSTENEPALHPTAVIDASAQIADGVRVGPYAIVEARVAIGEGCTIAGHAVIGEDTRIGRHNAIHHHAVVGTASQDGKWRGERTGLVVGDENVIREFATLNRATGEGNVTRIGSRCRLLAYSHVAHNTVIEDRVILANCAEVGGEALVEEGAIVGGLVAVHQRCRIGAFAIVGAGSKVTQDILPFITADGHPARPKGLNVIGLRRSGFSAEAISHIKAAYHCLFRRGVRLDAALEALCRDHGDSAEVMRMVTFIRSSERRIARPRGRSAEAYEAHLD
jgi:UDP-N-acetylglucosamine acyltransferase